MTQVKSSAALRQLSIRQLKAQSAPFFIPPVAPLTLVPQLARGFFLSLVAQLNAAHTRFRMKDFKQTYFTPTSTINPYLMNATTPIDGGDASDQNALGVTVNGLFSLLGCKHELVVGMESLRVKITATSGLGDPNPLNNSDINTWDLYASYPEPFVATITKGVASTTSQRGHTPRHGCR